MTRLVVIPVHAERAYKYRRDLQGHQRRSEKCPKTAWINKAKIEEYGQAPEHVKKSLALISKWKAERERSTGGELPRKDSNPVVAIKQKESPKTHSSLKSKNKQKRDSHEIVRSIDSETKRVEKTVKIENIVEELTARRDKPNQSQRTRQKRNGCSEEITNLYPCTCGKSYTHRENLRKHLCRSLCNTTSYVRKLLAIKNNKIFVKSETPVKSERTSSPIKLEPFEDAVFAIGLDLVNKECGREQEKREEVAKIYRTKGGLRKPVKRLVNLNKKFRCKCGKEFKHSSSLYNHRRMSAKCRDTQRAAETSAASRTSPAAKPDHHNHDITIQQRTGDNLIESENKNNDQGPELNSNDEAGKKEFSEDKEIKPDDEEVDSNKKATLRSFGKLNNNRSASIVSKNLVKKSKDKATKRRIEERKLGPYTCPCGKEYTLIRALQRHQKKSKPCPKTAWKLLPREQELKRPVQIMLLAGNTAPLDTNNNGTVSEDEDRLSSKDFETQTEGNRFTDHYFLCKCTIFLL